MRKLLAAFFSVTLASASPWSAWASYNPPQHVSLSRNAVNEGMVKGNAAETAVGTDTVLTYATVGNTTFTPPKGTTSVRVLVVAGGGAGSANTSGGGGAGGYLTYAALPVVPGTSITVTVGAGGTSPANAKGNNGGNSVFGSTTAIGGGAGGWSSGVDSGNAGGSGGGATVSGTPGAGTSGQGFAGGSITSWSGVFGATGGGGAGGAGGNQSGSAAGVGGVGLQNDISGTNTYYAGGGGGGANTESAAGIGGLGGGGDGSNPSGESNDGAANTGGGGGGQSTNIATRGGHGGSGIVIVRFRTQTSVSLVRSSASKIELGSLGVGGTVEVDDSSATVRGSLFMADKARLQSRTKAQLNALTPTVGDMYYCSDCSDAGLSKPTVVIGTGTIGGFATFTLGAF